MKQLTLLIFLSFQFVNLSAQCYVGKCVNNAQGPAGGVLSGNYPNPIIAVNANLGVPGFIDLRNSTGLTNANLQYSYVTVNTVQCFLGGTCTITASAGGAAGGVLSGSYPNPAIAAGANLGTPGTINLVNSTGLTNANLQFSSFSLFSATCTLGGSCSPTIPVTSLSGVLTLAQGGTGVTTAQGNGSKVQLASGSFVSGHCINYDASGNATDAGAACGTGGGGGTSTSSGLIDFFSATTRTSNTVLTIGASCTTSAPCITPFGSITAPGVLTLSGSATNTIYVEVDVGPVINVITPTGSLALSCSGCSVVNGTGHVSSVPLFTWPASAGVWAAFAASFDNRVWMSGIPPVTRCGTGLTPSTVGNVTTCNVTGGGGGATYIPSWRATCGRGVSGTAAQNGFVLSADCSSTTGSTALDPAGVLLNTSGTAIYYLDWDGTTALTGVIRFLQQGGGSGGTFVNWTMAVACPTTVGTVSFGTGVTVTPSTPGTGVIGTTTPLTLVTSGCSAGYLYVKITRGTSGDTYGSGVYLLGVTI